jgi:hypothetical protein
MALSSGNPRHLGRGGCARTQHLSPVPYRCSHLNKSGTSIQRKLESMQRWTLSAYPHAQMRTSTAKRPAAQMTSTPLDRYTHSAPLGYVRTSQARQDDYPSNEELLGPQFIDLR